MHAAVVSESKILAGHDVVKQLHSMLPHFQQVRFHLFIPGTCGCAWPLCYCEEDLLPLSTC